MSILREMLTSGITREHVPPVTMFFWRLVLFFFVTWALNPEGEAELLDKQWTEIGRQAKQAWLTQHPQVLIGRPAAQSKDVGSPYTRYTSEAQP